MNAAFLAGKTGRPAQAERWEDAVDRWQYREERSAAIPGASALTAAELRLLPLLSTHLSAPEIAEELFLSLHTIKSQMRSIYRKLGVSSRNQAITGARELGLLEGLRRVFTPFGGMKPALAAGGLVSDDMGGV